MSDLVWITCNILIKFPFSRLQFSHWSLMPLMDNCHIPFTSKRIGRVRKMPANQTERLCLWTMFLPTLHRYRKDNPLFFSLKHFLTLRFRSTWKKSSRHVAKYQEYSFRSRPQFRQMQRIQVHFSPTVSELQKCVWNTLSNWNNIPFFWRALELLM